MISRSAVFFDLSMVTGLSGQFYLRTIPACNRIAAPNVPLYLHLNSTFNCYLCYLLSSTFKFGRDEASSSLESPIEDTIIRLLLTNSK